MRIVLAGVVALFCCVNLGRSGDLPHARPNIVLIMCDDM